MSIFQTVEFYVIVAFIAAAVVGACAVPSRKGAVRTFFYSGVLSNPAGPSNPTSQAGIVCIVSDMGKLEIYRFGLEGIHDDGAYSLAVKISGFDVIIEERLTAGSTLFPEMTRAYAEIDCLGAERYHFQYISEYTSRKAAFSLNIRPGNRIERRLEV